MSDLPAIDPAASQPVKPAHNRQNPRDPNVRLRAIQRELQRLAKRKLRAHQLSALRYAALLQLRAEAIAFDGSAGADSIVRLANASRRARADYVALIQPEPAQDFTMADIEAELAANG